MDREVWCATVHGVTRWTLLSYLTELNIYIHIISHILYLLNIPGGKGRD